MCARLRARAGRQQLVARDEEADARRGGARGARRGRRRPRGPRPGAGAGDRRRGPACPPARPRRPRRRVVPGGRRRARRAGPPPPSPPPRGSTASAPSGTGAPVMIRTASPGPTVAGRDARAAQAPTTRARGVGLRGAEGVLAAHGPAVHRRARERRHVDGGRRRPRRARGPRRPATRPHALRGGPRRARPPRPGPSVTSARGRKPRMRTSSGGARRHGVARSQPLAVAARPPGSGGGR